MKLNFLLIVAVIGFMASAVNLISVDTLFSVIICFCHFITFALLFHYKFIVIVEQKRRKDVYKDRPEEILPKSKKRNWLIYY